MSNTLCPICYEGIPLLEPVQVEWACHQLHKKCMTELLTHGVYKCPLCRKSYIKNMIKAGDFTGIRLEDLISNHPDYIRFVENQSTQLLLSNNRRDTLAKLAVSRSGTSLRFIHKQTQQLCITAVKNNVFAFRYVEDRYKTKKMCKHDVTICSF